MSKERKSSKEWLEKARDYAVKGPETLTPDDLNIFAARMQSLMHHYREAQNREGVRNGSASNR